MLRKTMSVVLAIAMLCNILVITAAAQSTQKESAIADLPSRDEIRALVNQMYERGEQRMLMREQPLEIIEVDNSNIIHRPANEMPMPELEIGSGIRPFGLINDKFSGPFKESDERYFRIEVRYDGVYKSVKAKLFAQGNNTNVWLVDDTDFHAKIGRPHDDSTCTLDTVTYAQAKDLATGFDGIYGRMTTDFALHNLYDAPFTDMKKFGDLGDDDHVNILLYDIDALDVKGGGYVAGFFWNYDMLSNGAMYDETTSIAEYFGDEDDIHAIDVFHVDIGTDEGWDSFSGTPTDKLEIYGTLAHEFQHMLYFEHFGIYPKYGGDDWFNESLSGLADMYYVQPGAEIVDLGRTAFAASNPYDGDGYGDFLNFNNSFKNYGMGYMFSALFHNGTGGAYVKSIYDFFTADSMANDGTVAGFNSKRTYVNGTLFGDGIPAYLIGAALSPFTGVNVTTTYDCYLSLAIAYFYFMQNFAADGGMVNAFDGDGDELISPSRKLLRGTSDIHNLWYLRPRIGYDRLAVIDPIPTLPNGGSIVMQGYCGDSQGYASHDMLYKLENPDGKDMITITVNDEIDTTFYYVAVPNDNAAAGADIYELEIGAANPNSIATNGKPAYLFAATFLRSVGGVTVDYEWFATPNGYLQGTATITNNRAGAVEPRIGDTLTPVYNGSDIIPILLNYKWYRGEGSASIAGGQMGLVQPYTVQPADLGYPLSVGIYDATVGAGKKLGTATAITAPVGKTLYSGTVPAAPTLSGKTHNSIILVNVENCEYSNGGAVWQDSSAFTGLSPNTSYTFYQRIKEAAYVEASEISAGFSQATDAYTAATPSISTQPSSAVYSINDSAAALTVAASVADNGTLSYKWYSNAINDTTGGTLVSDANTTSYTPPTSATGTTYFYCVVTNTKEGSVTTGASNTAAITVHDGTTLLRTDKTSYVYGEDIIFSINATAEEVALYDKVEFYYNSTKLGELTTPNIISGSVSYSTSSKTMPIGTSTVTAKFYTGAAEKYSCGVSVTINKLSLTAAVAAGTNRAYNADVDCNSTSLTLFGAIIGDTITATADGTIDSKNVGARTFTATSVTLGGIHSGYYTLATADVGGSITVTPFTLTSASVAAAQEKTYNGDVNYTGATLSCPGVFNGDVVTATADGTIDDKDVGTRTFTAASVSLGGAHSGNYSLDVGVVTSGNIDIIPKAATITANNISIDLGATPTFTATAAGLAGTETLTDVTFDCTYTAASPAGAYSIEINTYTISGGNGNYNINTVNGTLTVSRKYTVAVTNGAGGGDYNAGANVTVTANAAPSGQRFKQWIATGLSGVTLTANPLAFTMPANNVSLTAQYENIQSGNPGNNDNNSNTGSNGGNSNGSNNGGYPSDSGATAPVPAPSVDTTPTPAKTQPTQQPVQPVQQPKQSAQPTQPTVIKTNKSAVNITKQNAVKLADKGLSLTIQFPIATVTLCDKALSAIAGRASGGIQINAVRVDESTYEFTITSGGKPISDFDGGKATITIPSQGEHDDYVVYYIADNGEHIAVPISHYDAEKGKATFVVYHFSKYTLLPATTTFTDTGAHWAKDYVRYAASRTLLRGVDEDAFAPDVALTRGMFVTILGRLVDVDVSEYAKGEYYTPYMEWAAELGMISADSDPLRSINRESVAYALAVFAGKYGIPLKSGDLAFSDSDKVSDWAKASVAKIAATGIMQGDNRNAFDPQGNTTRAQFSVVLKRMVMLMTVGNVPMEDKRSANVRGSRANAIAMAKKEEGESDADDTKKTT